jgi:hypothetical protein
MTKSDGRHQLRCLALQGCINRILRLSGGEEPEILKIQAILKSAAHSERISRR